MTTKRGSSKKATEDVMNELHRTAASVMLAKLNSGEVSASDLSVIVKFLQNNHIVIDVNDEDGEARGSALSELRKLAMPKFSFGTEDDNDNDGITVN